MPSASPLTLSSALPQAQPRRSGVARARRAAGAIESRALELIDGSLSVRRIARTAPWLANLHRLSDGTLLGLGFCMFALSALTLHWQARWGHSYRELEATQVLEHRMQEASAVLEQHHLAATRRTGQLVPTRSERLVYLSAPPQTSAADQTLQALNHLQTPQITPGY